MRKKSCYIVTKPIQYINATNIEDDNIKDCYITNTFSDAKKFADEMNKLSNHWERIHFAISKQNALKVILRHKSEYSKLYLDSDVGIILRIFLVLLYPVKIYVYEEGLASYTPEIREKKINSFKFFIDRFFGKNWSGGSFRTEGIYLYHPKAFQSLVETNKKIQILPFKQPLMNHLNSLSDIKIFYSQDEFDFLKGKNILLYLTSWTLNPLYQEIYYKYPEFIKIIKFHPHIKKESASNNLLHFDFYPDSTIPAEILISTFIEIAGKIVIIHEGTAAMLNFIGEKKIIEYNIADAKYNAKYMKVKKEFEKELIS